MNRSETATLLTLAAAFDRRTIGEADVVAWADVLHHVDYVDAQVAVKAHYAESTDWVMPAHILRKVYKIRADRLQQIPEIDAPDADPDDVPEYLAALREGRRRSASPDRRQIDVSRVFPALPPGDAS